ncbi:MAG: hypothetical protein LBT60_05235 [Oscillospiraceae bacterium]|jgi:hypothetical protein|nr:hypothetical protein [Oscillospiraceae bacterium]
MKKQGVALTRFIFLILFAFVMAFMGYHVVEALISSVETVDAVLYTAERTVTLNGYFVRDELVLPQPDSIWEAQALSGQRLAKGDPLALTYQDTKTQEENAEAKALEARIEQLKLINRHSADMVSVADIDGLIAANVLAIAAARESGDLSSLSDSGVTLRSLLYKRSYTYENGADVNILLGALTEQLARMRAQMGGALGQISAPEAGTFGDKLDGFEGLLTLSGMDTMPLADFLALTRTDPAAPPAALGKLSIGFVWRYAAVVSEDDAKVFTVDKSVSFRVDKSSGRTVSARVTRVTPVEDGHCLLVLEGNVDMAYFSQLRRAQADVVQEIQTGIRVPREAVTLDADGNPGVFCLVHNQAVFKPVEIVLEKENYFLMKYVPPAPEDALSNTPDKLLPGDEVIVSGRDIYDGKIIQE